MYRNGLCVALVCALVATLPSCRSAPPLAPNVILIVVDTLRADRLGAYGNTRGLTPFLDELAARGAIFTNAYAASSWTVPSVASILTSRLPSQHHVSTFESKIGDEEITVAKMLAAAGYKTAGVTANFRLTSELGYAQGFLRWTVVPGVGVKSRGDAVNRVSLAWLGTGGTATSQPPRFLYLQYMEPHSPYEPPEPYRHRFERVVDGADAAGANALMQTLNFAAFTPAHVDILQSLYDGEVASVDAQLRALFAGLEKRGFLQHAVVIVTADHGEEFKEHGRMGHGHDLYNETVRVPLIVLAPGLVGGKVIDEDVSLIDVAPTILDLAGLPQQPNFEGRSLVPLIQRHSLLEWVPFLRETPPAVIIELPRTGSTFDIRAHSQSIVAGPYKLLIGLRGSDNEEERLELYDLSRDPGETSPLDQVERSQALQTALEARTDALVKRAGLTREVGSVDEATKEKLRALGYHF